MELVLSWAPYPRPTPSPLKRMDLIGELVGVPDDDWPTTCCSEQRGCAGGDFWQNYEHSTPLQLAALPLPPRPVGARLFSCLLDVDQERFKGRSAAPGPWPKAATNKMQDARLPSPAFSS